MRTYAERRCLSHELELECSQTSLSLTLSRKREREHASVFHKLGMASENSPLPLVGEGSGERARCASVFATTEFRKPLSLALYPQGARTPLLRSAPSAVPQAGEEMDHARA